MEGIFSKIKAVIFDMDGVLIDSEPVMAKAAARAFNDEGIPAKESDFEQFCGAGEIVYFGGVAKLYGGSFDKKIRDRAYETYFKIVKKEASVYPRVMETLEKLKEEGIPTAVASSADIEKVYANLDAVLDGKRAETYFAKVITGSDVEKNKPDPEIFIKAAAKLGYDPKDCVVFEDSINGVKAAKASGSLCCALTTANTPEKLQEAGADIIAGGIDILYDPSKIIQGESKVEFS
jgi:cytidine deaminase